jgi:hypothetical protein
MAVRLNQPPKTLSNSADDMAWLEQLARIVNAGVSSGTTAQRPTTLLYPGRPYFDTDLGSAGKGMMIWRNSDNTGWVNGSGASV